MSVTAASAASSCSNKAKTTIGRSCRHCLPLTTSPPHCHLQTKAKAASAGGSRTTSSHLEHRSNHLDPTALEAEEQAPEPDGYWVHICQLHPGKQKDCRPCRSGPTTTHNNPAAQRCLAPCPSTPNNSSRVHGLNQSQPWHKSSSTAEGGPPQPRPPTGGKQRRWI